jgi:hypothetical protein
MDISYRPPFRRFVKKQARAFQLAIEDAAFEVIGSPDIGEAKRGDLSGFRVHKFRFQGQEYLIAYALEAGCIVFYMIDSHENFYVALKRYIKEAK